MIDDADIKILKRRIDATRTLLSQLRGDAPLSKELEEILSPQSRASFKEQSDNERENCLELARVLKAKVDRKHRGALINELLASAEGYLAMELGFAAEEASNCRDFTDELQSIIGE